MAERGGTWVSRRKSVENTGARLADVEARIKGTTARLGEDISEQVEEELRALLREQKAERAELKKPRSAGWKLTDVHGDWHRAADVNERRAILLSHMDELSVASRGKTSHRFDPNRVTLTWQPEKPDAYTEESDLADKQARWG